eukprot:4387540-Amphidinium_carterae.1
MAAKGPASPPEPPTEEEALAHRDLDEDVQATMRNYRVPYVVWGMLARDGYTTLLDVADRWISKLDCREKAGKDYGIQNGENGFDAKTAQRAIIRLAQATEEARMRVTKRSKILAEPASAAAAKAILETMSRHGLEDAYAARNGGIKPPLQDQGSDTLLGHLFKAVQGGHLPFIEAKQVVPYLPDADLGVLKLRTRSTNLESMVREETSEELELPRSFEGVRRLWTVWKTSLQMVLDSQPQQTLLAVPHDQLDSLYRFIDGPRLARKQPQPTAMVMLLAERAAWREIVILLHGGKTLSNALECMEKDALFWQQHVYSKDNQVLPPPAGYMGYTGKGGKWTVTKGGKNGKYPKGTSKGSGIPTKGQQQQQPKQQQQQPKAKWAEVSPRGKQYCRNFHTTGCFPANGQTCGRSHNCPGWQPPHDVSCEVVVAEHCSIAPFSHFCVSPLLWSRPWGLRLKGRLAEHSMNVDVGTKSIGVPCWVRLYSGPRDATSLSAVALQLYPPLAQSLLEIDLCNGWDVLDSGVADALLALAAQGWIHGIAAGPPCRTWSKLRHRPGRSGP